MAKRTLREIMNGIEDMARPASTIREMYLEGLESVATLDELTLLWATLAETCWELQIDERQYLDIEMPIFTEEVPSWFDGLLSCDDMTVFFWCDAFGYAKKMSVADWIMQRKMEQCD